MDTNEKSLNKVSCDVTVPHNRHIWRAAPQALGSPIWWECPGIKENKMDIEPMKKLIVDLAETGPPLDGELGICTLCSSPKLDNWKSEDHRPTCPWRRAVEFVAKEHSEPTIKEDTPQRVSTGTGWPMEHSGQWSHV